MELGDPNTELLRLLNGAAIWLPGMEGATAAAGHNADGIGAVIDAIGHHCSHQVVRGGQSLTPEGYRERGIQHLYLEINHHMKKPRPGHPWSITDLPTLLAQFVYILQWMAEGMSVQIHCISPLSHLHRFPLLGLYFRLPDSPPLPK